MQQKSANGWLPEGNKNLEKKITGHENWIKFSRMPQIISPLSDRSLRLPHIVTGHVWFSSLSAIIPNNYQLFTQILALAVTKNVTFFCQLYIVNCHSCGQGIPIMMYCEGPYCCMQTLSLLPLWDDNADSLKRR